MTELTYLCHQNSRLAQLRNLLAIRCDRLKVLCEVQQRRIEELKRERDEAREGRREDND